jgi:hypothetical protein
MAIARDSGAGETIQRFKEGDRIVVGHQWYIANRYDVIKETHRTKRNRLLVGFDQDELDVGIGTSTLGLRYVEAWFSLARAWLDADLNDFDSQHRFTEEHPRSH